MCEVELRILYFYTKWSLFIYFKLFYNLSISDFYLIGIQEKKKKYIQLISYSQFFFKIQGHALNGGTGNSAVVYLHCHSGKSFEIFRMVQTAPNYLYRTVFKTFPVKSLLGLASSASISSPLPKFSNLFLVRIGDLTESITSELRIFTFSIVYCFQ